MFSALKCLFMPVERVSFNAVINLLHQSHVNPASLPVAVLEHLVNVSAASRFQRVSPFSRRVRAIRAADFAVGQLVRWLDALVLPDISPADPWFVTHFSEHINPSLRKSLSRARVNSVVNPS